MNVAWAYHEGVADHMVPCLMWLRSGGELDLKYLARKLGVDRLRDLTMKRVHWKPPPPPPRPSAKRRPPPQKKGRCCRRPQHAQHVQRQDAFGKPPGPPCAASSSTTNVSCPPRITPAVQRVVPWSRREMRPRCQPHHLTFLQLESDLVECGQPHSVLQPGIRSLRVITRIRFSLAVQPS